LTSTYWVIKQVCDILRVMGIKFGKPETTNEALEMLQKHIRPRRTRLATLPDIRAHLEHHIALSLAGGDRYSSCVPLIYRMGVVTPELIYEMEGQHSFYRYPNPIYATKVATLSPASPWPPMLTGREGKPAVGWFEVYGMKPSLPDGPNVLVSVRYHAYESKAGFPPREHDLTKTTWQFFLGIVSNIELTQLTGDLDRTKLPIIPRV